MRIHLMLLGAGILLLTVGSGSGAPREVTFMTQDSVTIYGTLQTPEGNEESPGLVLLPMLMHKRKDWNAFAAEAVQAGFTVLAIDLRGHGQSVSRGDHTLDAREFSNAEFAKMVEDVRAAVGFLQAQNRVDARRISVLGASIGANLALRYAATDTTIRSVGLLSPGLDYRGLTTEDAMKTYGERPVLLIAARDDDYSSDCVQRLATLAKGPVEMQLYEKAGHGNFMFRSEPGLGRRIVEWLKSAGQ